MTYVARRECARCGSMGERGGFLEAEMMLIELDYFNAYAIR